MNILLSIVGFIFSFSLIVIVHELGHFMVARKKGIRVDKFAFGFPPKLWSKKKGETEYAINLIPVGGYVSLHGEDGSDDKNPRSFASKSAGARIAVLVAGVVMNFILAWFIIFGSYLFGMQPIIPGMTDHEGIRNDLKVVITEVEKDTPAEQEGLKSGDVIKKVDGKDITIYLEVISILEEKLSKGEEGKINVEIDRNGEILNKEVETYKSKIQDGDKEYEINRIGVVLEDQGKVSAPFFTAIWVSFLEMGNLFLMTFQAIGELFGKLITSLAITDKVTGPVGAFVMAGALTQMGIGTLLQFVATISVAIGVFNLLPIPALDGGHILIIGIEKILKRKLSNKAKNISQLVGFALMMALVLAITFKDVVRFDII